MKWQVIAAEKSFKILLNKIEKKEIYCIKKGLDSFPVNGRKLPPMAVESDPIFSILPRKIMSMRKF